MKTVSKKIILLTIFFIIGGIFSMSYKSSLTNNINNNFINQNSILAGDTPPLIDPNIENVEIFKESINSEGFTFVISTSSNSFGGNDLLPYRIEVQSSEVSIWDSGIYIEELNNQKFDVVGLKPSTTYPEISFALINVSTGDVIGEPSFSSINQIKTKKSLLLKISTISFILFFALSIIISIALVFKIIDKRRGGDNYDYGDNYGGSGGGYYGGFSNYDDYSKPAKQKKPKREKRGKGGGGYGGGYGGYGKSGGYYGDNGGYWNGGWN